MIQLMRSIRAAHLLAVFALTAAILHAADPAAPAAAPLPKHAPESPVEQALHEKISWEFVELPLADVAEKIQNEQKINVVFDKKALEEAGAGTDTPITFKAAGVTLSSALRLLLANLDLTYFGEGNVLAITTPEKANNRLLTKVYDVRDLVGDAGEVDMESLIDVVTKTIAPTTWDEVGGPGSIKPHRKTLIISQTQEVDDQIQQLLSALRKAEEGSPQHERVWADESLNVAAMEQIRQKLTRPVPLDYRETPLAEAMEAIEKNYLIPIHFDKKALEEAGAGTDTPITFQITDVGLGEALKTCLERLDLTYIVRDEVLLITTPEKANNYLQTAVYPVADLISKPGADEDPDYEHLQEVIKTTIAPTTWDEVGGPGSIKPFENSQSFVISQTQEVQAQLADLFAKLRAKQGQVSTGAVTTPIEAPSVESPEQRESHESFVVRIYLLKSVNTPTVVAKSRSGGGGFFQVGGAGEAPKPAPDKNADAASVTPVPCGTFAQNARKGQVAEQGNPMLAAELAVAIKEVVEPTAWDVRGTTIRPIAGNLVVRQTLPVHRKIAEFLKKLGVLEGQR